jgi:hypothetical protein
MQVNLAELIRLLAIYRALVRLNIVVAQTLN